MKAPRRRGAREFATSAPATIFLVDDDDSFRRLLAKQLVAHGYAVVEAGDGAAALEWLAITADGEGTPPDVVVLDVSMPGYSGLGILKAMRGFAARPPTLIITGFRDSSVDVLARNLGAARVLHKPVDLDDVLDAVLDAILRRSATA
ncbi:MAG TPA: response regulator [Labilithrix sp.]|nr:response regulator [Labilithrix sp.]